jgi:hypothetical protein
MVGAHLFSAYHNGCEVFGVVRSPNNSTSKSMESNPHVLKLRFLCHVSSAFTLRRAARFIHRSASSRPHDCVTTRLRIQVQGWLLRNYCSSFPVFQRSKKLARPARYTITMYAHGDQNDKKRITSSPAWARTTNLPIAGPIGLTVGRASQLRHGGLIYRNRGLLC